jgi:transcriptional regulator with XRE-family HTH domain
MTHPMSETQLSEAQSRSVAAMVREELARRRISRQRLADQARISISTLEKALAGRRPFTLATTIRLEDALGVALRKNNAHVPAPEAHGGLAPVGLGSYSHPAVSWLEGAYLTLRPSFSDPVAVYAYRTEIRWDADQSCLVFRENERIDAEYAQDGLVSVPNQSGFIYLITNRQGQYRLVIMSRVAIRDEMFGIMTTLQAGRGADLTPVSVPVAYVPMKALATAEFGRIAAGHVCYERYRAYLKRTIEEQFALFLPV